MKTFLWAEDEPAVAAWVSEGFPHIEGFPAGCRAVAWVTDEGRIVGGLVLAPRGGWFDAELSIRFERGCAFTRRQLRHLFRGAFRVWGFRRLTVHVAADNTPSRRLVERLGWRQEGVLRRGYDGTRDAVVYGLLADECPYLR